MGRKSDDVTTSPAELFAGGEEERRRAEARAELDHMRHEAQAHITNTLERITDGFISLDREWRYTYINRAATVMAHRPSEDFIGKNIWDVYPDALGTAYETQFKRAMREQTPVEFEEYLPSADVWFGVSAYPSVDGLSVFFRDVTKRKQAEKRLRESEERYRTLFNSIDEGFCIIELIFDDMGKPRDYRFVEFNPTFEKQIGLENAAGKTAREMVPNLESRWFEIYGKVALTGDPVRFVDGSEVIGRWFDVYAFRVGDETSRKVAVLFNDITSRKKFELERERFFAVSSDFQAITGPDGYFKWVSPACERTLGWTADEMTSQPWVNFMHPDDVGKSISETDNLFAGNETIAFENRYRHKDGSYRWLLWNAQPYLEENLLYGTAIDITTRKYTEERLRESEERYRLMTENAKDYAIIFLDTDAHIKTWSSGAERILGWKEEEVVGQLGWIIFTPEDRANGIPEKELSTAAAKGRAADERWHVRKDGSRFFGSGEMIGLFDEAGELRGFAKIFRDLTERKRMDDALRESEEKFRNLANSISQFAWMADAEGYIFWYNQRWFDYTGTTLEEMQGWGWQKVHHPEEVERVVKSFSQAIATGEPWEETFPLRSRYGEYRWFLSRALPIRDELGRITRWFGTNTDVEELRQARKSAEEASRLKDEFLATVSHELRTPLTAVIGWTHILRAGQLDEAGAARALETVERNARAQNQLIEDLLDISRIITGKLRLDVRPIDPVGFLEAAIEAVHPAAEAKGVRLQKVLDTGTGAISGDADRLQQVVWNLLSNAIKFTPKGGRVQLRLERINSHVEIIVTDTGAGIKPEFLPFVFDRFRQADGSTTRAHGGLGLGLAIARNLVELHGGTVHADSHGEGRGATFTVTLPLVPIYQRGAQQEARVHPRASSSLPPAESDEQLDGVRLLVVDDEADAGEMLRAMLTGRGAEVVVARSAEEALAEIERSPFDLLISDIGMSGVDGYELLSRVRNLPAASGGRILAVALTAYARTEDRLRALRAGFQMHVPKPVDSAELIAVVSSLTARRKLSENPPREKSDDRANNL
ncbi:MAG: PAS domain S-box protein [Acidobacteriota bacterium]|nr:PAS domain S-box protein [Acidobacteriota bacterium]